MLIKLIVDRVEEDKAILLTPTKETIIWPLSQLPIGAKEGDKFKFSIVDEQGGDKDLAKDLLNEILDIQANG